MEMGKTGETYLVDENGFMISESRFASTLKKMGLIRKRTALELKLVNPETGRLTKVLEERECINNFNRIIASSPLTEVFDAAGNELRKLIDFDRFSITTYREKDDPFFLTFVLTKHHISEELRPGIPSRKEGSLFELVLSTGKPVIVPDTEKGKLWSDKVLLKEGIRSRMAYPLIYKGEIIGVANFGSKKSRNYSEKDFDILAQVAPQLAIVLENARIIDRLQTAKKV